MIRRLKTMTSSRWTMPLLLVAGFVGDVFQFTSLEPNVQLLVAAAYAGICLVAYAFMSRPTPEAARLARARRVIPAVHQFTLGGMLSTSLLFYWFSGSWSVSWPLLLALVTVLVSNEVLRKDFDQPTTQFAIMSFATFSLASVGMASLLQSFEPSAFVAAGMASGALMGAYATWFARFTDRVAERPSILSSVLTVHVLFFLAYALNVIPPLPLAIREAGIYADVKRVGTEYALTGDTETWLDALVPGQTVTIPKDGPVYAFVSIYAPAERSVTIVHRWQRFNAATREWDTASTASYEIRGGRQQGYRGYSLTSLVTPGIWRVRVETADGRALGSILFSAQK